MVINLNEEIKKRDQTFQNHVKKLEETIDAELKPQLDAYGVAIYRWQFGREARSVIEKVEGDYRRAGWSVTIEPFGFGTFDHERDPCRAQKYLLIQAIV